MKQWKKNLTLFIKKIYNFTAALNTQKGSSCVPLYIFLSQGSPISHAVPQGAAENAE